MDNPDKKFVVDKIAASSYAELFKAVYGPEIFKNIDNAYDMACDAMAAFEESTEFNSFSSRYDLSLGGKGKLSSKEMKGLAFFEDTQKGNCAACHPSKQNENGVPTRFTDFSYDNSGVPRNEVPETVNKKELGNLGLTDEEVDAIVAFLQTLSDQPIKKNND